jgi:hypothetical protein
MQQNDGLSALVFTHPIQRFNRKLSQRPDASLSPAVGYIKIVHSVAIRNRGTSDAVVAASTHGFTWGAVSRSVGGVTYMHSWHELSSQYNAGTSEKNPQQ